MKKIIVIKLIILTLAILVSCWVNSQVNQLPAKDTLIKGRIEVLHTGTKGGKYILVTSKSGNVYKKYLTNKKQ